MPPDTHISGCVYRLLCLWKEDTLRANPVPRFIDVQQGLDQLLVDHSS